MKMKEKDGFGGFAADNRTDPIWDAIVPQKRSYFTNADCMGVLFVQDRWLVATPNVSITRGGRRIDGSTSTSAATDTVDPTFLITIRPLAWATIRIVQVIPKLNKHAPAKLMI